MRRPSGFRPRNPWKPGRFLLKTAHLKPRTVRMEGVRPVGTDRKSTGRTAPDPPAAAGAPDRKCAPPDQAAGLPAAGGAHIAGLIVHRQSGRLPPAGAHFASRAGYCRSGCISPAGLVVAGRAAFRRPGCMPLVRPHTVGQTAHPWRDCRSPAEQPPEGQRGQQRRTQAVSLPCQPACRGNGLRDQPACRGNRPALTAGPKG